MNYRIILLFLLSGLSLAQKAPTVDGTIGSNEYTHRVSSRIRVELYWAIQGDLLYIGLKSPSRGWVGMGFETLAEHSEKGSMKEGEKHPAMHGSDLLLGYVRDGRTVTEELYGAVAGQPQSYPKLGDKRQIIRAAARESASGTTLELVRRLNMGGPRHVNLQAVVGHRIGIMLAYGNGKDFAYHGPANRVAMEISLKP
ncbi:MAG: hypothetical protein K6T57_05630 [Thermaceae bacterium]|nr:hypothetical protein [Thermaceae bacterium]